MKPISLTAFWTAGVRMEDAEATSSICRDRYARLFANSQTDLILDGFKTHTKPRNSVLIRHRMIDDIINQKIADDLDSRIIVIGAGFDTRPYRMTGGDWVELDDPQIIQFKNERLPVSACSNRLARVAIDFESDSLKECLSVFQTFSPVFIIMEGVFMYLDQNQIVATVQTLRDIFPNHCLICDLMSRAFVNRFVHAFNMTTSQMGAPIKFLLDSPESLFEEAGYKLSKKLSVIEGGRKYGINVVSPIVRLLFRNTLIGGNSVCIFMRKTSVTH